MHIMNFKTYIPALLVLALVAAFHFLGTYGHLYYIFPYYDIPVHFLGGLWVGLSAIWFAKNAFRALPVTFGRMFAWVLSSTLCAAVLWEMFEFYSGLTYPALITSAGLTYRMDTFKDVAMGLFGATIAFVLAYMISERNTHKK